MSYWASRAQKENRKLYDSTLSEFEKELAAYYRVAAKDIKADILFLYADILASMESGEQLTMNQLYRYDRFVKLQKKINAILTDLGEKEIALSSKKYEMMGKYCSARIAKEAEKAGMKAVKPTFRKRPSDMPLLRLFSLQKEEAKAHRRMAQKNGLFRKSGAAHSVTIVYRLIAGRKEKQPVPILQQNVAKRRKHSVTMVCSNCKRN